ncbi:AAA family ATPase [Escherichia coli]
MSVDAPTIISISDIQQEQLAGSMRDGHRIIHGVAGSGKTLILYHRCQELAKKNDSEKPILVICYNITLAKKLRSMFINHPFAEKNKG